MFYIKNLILIFFITLSTYSQSQELTILTEDDPPYSLLREGKPTGFAVEVVNEIQRRLGVSYPIQIYPWARAYREIQDTNNTVVFTMSRTKEREKMFQWVGPIVESDWILVGDSNSNLVINNLDDAKKLKRIGTVREYAWTEYLKSQGFTNLDGVKSRKVNSMKLKLGRLDAFVSSDTGFKEEIVANDIDVKEFKVLYTIATVQMYIAFSKKANKRIVEQWQLTLDIMKKDGTFLKLHNEWLKGAKIPGIAKPGQI